MIKVIYSELDGPKGPTCRLEATGHAGYAPAGQDIVCAGASTLMQALVYLLAGTEGTASLATDRPEGPSVTVTAVPDAVRQPCVEGAFELAKAGFALLAERYPDNLSYCDTSARGEKSMMDLQLFAEGAEGPESSKSSPAPALSRAQQQQAIAAGTLKPAEARREAAPAEPKPKAESPRPTRPADADPAFRRLPTPGRPALTPQGRQLIGRLHARWAAEEARMRQVQPSFSLRQELKNPEMRRLMQLPGMRMADAYRLAHYEDAMRATARRVEQGVMERVRQRGARPLENGARPSSAAAVKPDVSKMTRAQREQLERLALHGAKIQF